MKTSDKVKTVVVFLFVLVLLFIAVSLSAQTNPFVHTITKEKSTGKELRSNKDCLSVSVTENDIIFIVSGTAYQAFQRNGTDRYGAPAWEDAATRKSVDVVIQKDGTVCIWKTEKKAFCYTPNKKIQQ
jgi:hypothetical protein